MEICMVFVWKNGLTEANSRGILYLFKLKYVFVIYIRKYFEDMNFKHKHVDWNHKICWSPCIKIWYNIQQWQLYWIE